MTDEIKLLKAEIKRLRKKLSEVPPSLGQMLRRRGLRIYKQEPTGDLLLPDRTFAPVYYKKLKKYSFRLFLRDVIKYQDYFTLDKVTRYATKEVSAGYIEFILKAGIAEPFRKGYRIKRRPITSFGETLEWFVAEIMKNELQAEAVRGVKFKGTKAGGDYDLIAKIDSSLLYMEIKSSPPKQIYDSEITEFFNRIADLSPDISLFFIDTELRMKDKIVPMFGAELRRRYGDDIPVQRIVKELFHINRKIFIINARGGISSNIETVLTFMWHNELDIT